MAITGINNSSYTSYYASGYKNTVKKAAYRTGRYKLEVVINE